MVAMRDRSGGNQGKGEGFRYAVNLPASYRHFDWQNCEILDVSGLGAVIRTRQILMGRDKVVLRLTHGSQSASVRTKVLHQAGMSAHLVFDSVGSDDKNRFLELGKGPGSPRYTSAAFSCWSAPRSFLSASRIFPETAVFGRRAPPSPRLSSSASSRILTYSARPAEAAHSGRAAADRSATEELRTVHEF
jgi:hypothetical protein